MSFFSLVYKLSLRLYNLDLWDEGILRDTAPEIRPDGLPAPKPLLDDVGH